MTGNSYSEQVFTNMSGKDLLVKQLDYNWYFRPFTSTYVRTIVQVNGIGDDQNTGRVNAAVIRPTDSASTSDNRRTSASGNAKMFVVPSGESFRILVSSASNATNGFNSSTSTSVDNATEFTFKEVV